ncbi:hypothetical protein MMC13_003461 [Lambiella insularis]|nr:hypothetical protein [Lambiella insularis]
MEDGQITPNDADQVEPDDPGEFAPKVFHEQVSRALSSAGHKRSLSGSILSKLSFLRSTPERSDTNNAPQIHSAQDEKQPSNPNALPSPEQKKTRKRKGSLRKTAILGTGRLRLEGRDKKGSPLEHVTTPQTDSGAFFNGADSPSDPISPESGDDLPTPRQSYEGSLPVETQKPNGTLHSFRLQHNNESDDILPLGALNRKSTLGDMSTTDEDDALTFSHSPGLSTIAPVLKKLSTGDSYFPKDAAGLQRRRSANKPKSPLASLPLEPLIVSEEWDYSDTEWWGWVVLIVTWIVFVVGMGSCFGVWSWAWDVGETPYAPPELNDDPTLPIVGYYPALIILTAVMAWVWVTVAWVGMKYFKHAKISGEDM